VLAGAALTYSLLATFVLSCVSRNRRANRADTQVLTLFGWTLMSGSFAGAALLLALAATLTFSA
jgi:hypothetical protein